MAIARYHSSEEARPETIIDVVERQLNDDAATGAVPVATGDEIHRVATECVQSLWAQSRVKAFLPVLAIRQARERLRSTAASTSSASVAPIAFARLIDELGGDLEVQMTYSRTDQWHASLTNRHTDDASMTVHVEGRGATMDEALQVAAVKARDVLLS